MTFEDMDRVAKHFEIEVVCYSPLEIEHIHPNDGNIGTATGTLAKMLMQYMYDDINNPKYSIELMQDIRMLHGTETNI